MRGCAMPLTNLVRPHVGNGNKSFPFLIAAPQALLSVTIHSGRASTLLCTQLAKAKAEFSPDAPTCVDAQQKQEGEDDEESFQVLTAVKSDYNDILIVDTPKSIMLLLDSSHNVHSILYKDQKWTGSYWDEFASLPAIVPKGPIGILGLGGGTAAHLMLDLWPSLQLEGWEIDEILIDKARDYFGLSDLEKTTEDGGILDVHIGDVFGPAENLHRRYTGIVVDLFSDGKVLPPLQEVDTWLELQERLMPDGRFMVNCGGINGGSSVMDGSADPEISASDETWILNPTLRALYKAFPQQLSWKRMPKESGENFMALTGPLPDLKSWSASVPSPLSTNVKHWIPCGPVSII